MSPQSIIFIITIRDSAVNYYDHAFNICVAFDADVCRIKKSRTRRHLLQIKNDKGTTSLFLFASVFPAKYAP